MTAFSLRPMEASDGPAVDALMREEGRTTAVSMSTHYRRDVIEAFQAQHPTSFGVVAVGPGSPALVGMATAFVDEVTIGGRIVACAHLENLKVRHDARRQGLGTRLAEWRIEEARRRFGGDGVIATMIDSTNTASLATAARWSADSTRPPASPGASIETGPRHLGGGGTLQLIGSDWLPEASTA
jgi:predicted N-acetyltransferase YhbS